MTTILFTGFSLFSFLLAYIACNALDKNEERPGLAAFCGVFGIIMTVMGIASLTAIIAVNTGQMK